MHLSYNVIKKESVKNDGVLPIETKYGFKERAVETTSNNEANKEPKDLNVYNNMADNIIKEAQEKANTILMDAINEIEEKKKEAYEEAYIQGKEKGYEDGYSEAYSIALEEVKRKEVQIMNNANSVMVQAQSYHERYLNEKEEEIRDTILFLCEEVLKREVKDCDGINELIFHTISSLKNVKKVVIKCNDNYYDNLLNNLEEWKKSLSYKAEFYVIKDNRVELGQAVVERDNGTTKIDLEYSMEKLKEIILYEEGV